MQRFKSPRRRIMSPAKAKASARARAVSATRESSPSRSLWPPDRRPASPSSPSYAPAGAGWGRRAMASPGEYDGLPFSDVHRAADAALDAHRAFVDNEYAELEAATKADAKIRRFRESLAAANAAVFVPPARPREFTPAPAISTTFTPTKLSKRKITKALLKQMRNEGVV